MRKKQKVKSLNEAQELQAEKLKAENNCYGYKIKKLGGKLYFFGRILTNGMGSIIIKREII